jgi:hypothetical protein
MESVPQGLFAGGGETRIDTVAKFIESTQRVLQKARTEEVLPGKLSKRGFRGLDFRGFRVLASSVASLLAFVTRRFSYTRSQRCWDRYSPVCQKFCKPDPFLEN